VIDTTLWNIEGLVDALAGLARAALTGMRTP